MTSSASATSVPTRVADISGLPLYCLPVVPVGARGKPPGAPLGAAPGAARRRGGQMAERTGYAPGTPSWVDCGTPDPEAARAVLHRALRVDRGDRAAGDRRLHDLPAAREGG